MDTGNLGVFAYGFMLALGLILPLGPQNSLVITAGAQSKRFIQTLPVVITASICDTLLIGLAVAGVSVAIMRIVWLKIPIVVVGVIFLVYLGWVNFTEDSQQPQSKSMLPETYKKQILVAASFSLFNPYAILDTIAVIGSTAMTYNGLQRIIFTTTCITVSWLWFLGLAKISQLLGARLQHNRWRQRVVATMLWISAIALIYRMLFA